MRYEFHVAFLSAMLTLGCGGVSAGPLEDGIAAYKRNEYTTALQKFRPLAGQGNAQAYVFLGSSYEYGNGVPKDYAEAIKWYRLAAEAGNARGQLNLGRMYDYGWGVSSDLVEGVKWFRLAAHQGNVEAQHRLALRYFLGQGVPQDYVQAYKWYSLVAISASEKRVRDDVTKLCDELTAKMTPAQIAEAQAMASKCQQSHSKLCD